MVVQFKNRIPIEVNDLISIPQGEDRVDPSFGSHHQDVRCLGVVLRQNAPYASVRVLTGQNMTEVTNVWLKKLQFVAKGFSLGILSLLIAYDLDMYNELGEEEMNISYNALSELFGVDLMNQLASLSEFFSPLKNRAKLYSNPLFLHDMMSNDKFKRWSKDMFRKTKAVATRLVNPASSSSDDDDDDDENANADKNGEKDGKTKISGKASSPIRGIMPPSEYLSDDDLFAMGSNRIEGKESPNLGDVVSLTCNRSQDALPEEKPNFFSKLFKPKKKTEGQTPTHADSLSSYPDTLQFRFSSDSENEESIEDEEEDEDDEEADEEEEEDMFERHSFDHYSYDESMSQNLKPMMLQRRSSEQGAGPRLHRSARRVARPTKIPSPFNTEVEHSKCVWLNVNSQVVLRPCPHR